jgi:hypothetical protein
MMWQYMRIKEIDDSRYRKLWYCLADVRYISLFVLPSYFSSRIGDAAYRCSLHSFSPLLVRENILSIRHKEAIISLPVASNSYFQLRDKGPVKKTRLFQKRYVISPHRCKSDYCFSIFEKNLPTCDVVIHYFMLYTLL